MAQTKGGGPPRLYPVLLTPRYSKQRLTGLRRLRALQTNQGLLTTFAFMCGVCGLFIYIETSRMLIPGGNVITIRSLRSITSGFSKDIPTKMQSQHKLPPHLYPSPRQPGAIVVGFSNCGGHDILSALSAHPDIVINTKDVKHFSNQGNKSQRWYTSQMPPSLEHHVTADVSYSYIMNHSALELIKSYNDTIRIIAFVCDPLSRLITTYKERAHKAVQTNKILRFQNKTQELKMATSDNFFDRNGFKTWVNVLKNGSSRLNADILTKVGDYFNPFLDLFHVFYRKQVLIVDKGSFYKNPKKELSAIHSFLKVHEIKGENYVSNVNNKEVCFTITHGKENCIRDTAKPLLQLMQQEDLPFMERVVNFYKKSNKKLFTYLKSNYTWYSEV